LKLLNLPKIRHGATLSGLGGMAPPSDETRISNLPYWPLDPEERRALVRKANYFTYHPYPHSRQKPLSLAPIANRSFLGRNSWIPNEPLRHLPQGDVTIQGIRFHLAPPKRGAKTFLKLGPNKSDRFLSETLPVNQKLEALFFLHLAGFAHQASEIGEYRIHFANRRQVSIPLHAPGRADAHAPPANLQDWWPSFPQISGEDFHPYIMTTDNDPFEYERYAYTLHWRNPHPTWIIRAIEVRLAARRRAQLGLLAVTTITRNPGTV